MGHKGIRKKIGDKEYVLVWVPAEDTTLGDAHYIDTTDYEIPTLAGIRKLLQHPKCSYGMCPQKYCTALVKEMSMRINLEGRLIITVECENCHKIEYVIPIVSV